VLQRRPRVREHADALVWAGDQLRVPGGNGVAPGVGGLDATNAEGDMYGRVSYLHAGGIDKPLLITKDGVETVVPRDTWRGLFHAGTSPTTGAVRDCPEGGGTGCLLINWPGWKTTASHGWVEEAPNIVGWYGGLVDGMRDSSGQMYMRNRYYDPATGQFTQADPIGLAGGLNAYGFADGDPVSYSDPYGLAPYTIKFAEGQSGERARKYVEQTVAIATRAHLSGDVRGTMLLGLFAFAAASPTTFEFEAHPFSMYEEEMSRGGFEHCSSQEYCRISLNAWDYPDLDGKPVIASHEIAGAVVDAMFGVRNRWHKHMGVAPFGENLMRGILGCVPRVVDHDRATEICR
jgi:RHS repeat-associated protein